MAASQDRLIDAQERFDRLRGHCQYYSQIDDVFPSTTSEGKAIQRALRYDKTLCYGMSRDLRRGHMQRSYRKGVQAATKILHHLRQLQIGYHQVTETELVRLALLWSIEMVHDRD